MPVIEEVKNLKIHPLCKRCNCFVSDAKESFDCYSKKCPSTNKHLKLDGFGSDPTRKPNWNPMEDAKLCGRGA
jgi:DNA polymerase III alpha subunit (gram-positive type)